MNPKRADGPPGKNKGNKENAKNLGSFRGIIGGLAGAGSWSYSDYPCYLWSDRVNDRRILGGLLAK